MNAASTDASSFSLAFSPQPFADRERQRHQLIVRPEHLGSLCGTHPTNGLAPLFFKHCADRARLPFGSGDLFFGKDSQAREGSVFGAHVEILRRAGGIGRGLGIQTGEFTRGWAGEFTRGSQGNLLAGRRG